MRKYRNYFKKLAIYFNKKSSRYSYFWSANEFTSSLISKDSYLYLKFLKLKELQFKEEDIYKICLFFKEICILFLKYFNFDFYRNLTHRKTSLHLGYHFYFARSKTIPIFLGQEDEKVLDFHLEVA